MSNKQGISYPIISLVQKIILYKTKARFYLVGCNNTETKFRVLKIDRTEPKELNVVDDKVEYTKREIRDLLNMIQLGNRSKQGQKFVTDLKGTISSFGIVGFVRFLEGYYLILITKRKRVAYIGHHTIYKIQDTCMVYIPNDGEKSMHPHEAKYVKLFQSMDLSSDFYFSYSYDLSHTLQYNMSVCRELSTFNSAVQQEQAKACWQESQFEDGDTPSPADNSTESEWSELKSNEELPLSADDKGEVSYGVRVRPHRKFVWNSFLLELVDLHPDWLLHLTHGFVGQSNLSVFGRSVYVTLIARRSKEFAGTRFLKRGTNDKGDVANEVESEQIVFDASVSCLSRGRFTAFVQMRGSVPSQWSQDVSKMVPKPTIALDLPDPFCAVSGRHFDELLRRFGSPVVMLNLVKRREQKRHESLLSEELCSALDTLNQFLPPRHRLLHVAFDMAHANKLKEASVMPRLAQIARALLSRVGLFHSRREFHGQSRPLQSLGGNCRGDGSRVQTGVVRVNCVDCLDRTNTAQFALGKAALAYQLYILGVLENPKLEFDTDCVRMLEELYEDHGDTLALQYGGSQLVHRVKTYRKVAPLSSHSRDILQTLSRYYSNTFSDADKQNAINLFLGVYRPSRCSVPIWELPTDFYLHNALASGERMCHRNLYTCWWDGKVMDSLPLALIEDRTELEAGLCEVVKSGHIADPRTDGFTDHYRPFEMSSVEELLAFTMSHSVRDVMPSSSSDFSPFSLRVRPPARPPNPSVTGKSSTASASSADSEDSEEDSGGESSGEDFVFLDSEESGYSLASAAARGNTFETIFSSMRQVYGTDLKSPLDRDLKHYKKFVNIGRYAGMFESSVTDSRSLSVSFKLHPRSSFTETPCPTVRAASLSVYASYVCRGEEGARTPPVLSAYEEFVRKQMR